MEEMEISLADIGAVVKRRWKMIILPALLVGIIGHWVSVKMETKQYSSVALIRVGLVRGVVLESEPTMKEIMSTQSVLEHIALKTGLPSDSETFDMLKKNLTYTSTDRLIRVSMVSDSPHLSYIIVSTAIDIIFIRHKIYYENADFEMKKVVTFVKEVVRPVPLSAGISEFISVPSEIVEKPTLPKEPIKQAKVPYFTAYFMGVLICLFVVFLIVDIGKVVRKGVQ